MFDQFFKELGESIMLIDIMTKNKPTITKVIFNGPATIVFWTDGTKTVVKCCNSEEFDKEKGLAMAITKKLYGNNKSGYYDIFRVLCK